MDAFQLRDLRQYDEIANVLGVQSDADWAEDRDLVDHQLRDPWEPS
ncbi:hypothetical protein [Kribbella sp. NPDC051620]